MVKTATATKMQNKLKDKGSVMIYLGPAMDHAADVHRFYNTSTSGTVKFQGCTVVRQDLW